MKTPYIICYGFRGDRFEKLKDLATRSGFGLRPVSDEEFSMTVEDLMVEGPIDNDRVREPVAERDLEHELFVGMGGEALSDFLDLCQEEDFYIPLKAGLTETNRKWTYANLVEENAQEHEFMKRMTLAQKGLVVARALHEEEADEEVMALAKEMEAFLDDPKEEDIPYFDDLYPRFMNKVQALLKERKKI